MVSRGTGGEQRHRQRAEVQVVSRGTGGERRWGVAEAQVASSAVR